MKIGLITSYKKKCGISTYSENMYKYLSEKLNIDIIPLPLEFKKINLKKYLDIVKETKKYDVLHIQHEHNLFGLYGVSALPFFYKLPKNKKIITTIHEIYPYGRNIIGHIRDKIILKYIIKKSDNIIVHTKHAKEYLINNLKINKNKIIVVSHGLEIKKCEKNEARKRLNLPLDQKIIVIPGFIRSNKQYEKIIENVSKDVLIIGAGGIQNFKEKKYLEKILLNKNFIKTDFLEHKILEDYICAADIVALYYKNVTMSGVLSIAMGMNKTIITSKTKTFEEIKKEYEYIYPIEDNEIKEIINKILKNNMKNNSKYIHKITWEEISKIHEKVYKI